MGMDVSEIIIEMGEEVDVASPLYREARKRVGNGARFLNTHVRGWRTQARASLELLDMVTTDYSILAIACKGRSLHGVAVHTSGDAVRAFRSSVNLADRSLGFYVTHNEGVKMEAYLQHAWKEELMRS